MTIPEYAIRRQVTIVMVTMGVIVLGLISFLRLPQELFPPIVFPQVTIVTDYANAAPEEIETLITKPIEEAVGSVSGLKHIESISREGRSTISVSFNWGQDIDFAALAVREKIDLIKERLPKEAEDPIVLKFDPLSRPIMILSVSGADIAPVQLKLLTEKVLKDNLEKVNGVASATISGGADREILVEIDQGRLHANHLSILEVIKSIEEANVTYPAGSIKKGLYEYLIRTVGEFRNVKEIEYAVAGVDTVEKIKREDTSFVEQGEGEGPRATVDSERTEDKQQLLEKRLVLTKDIAAVMDGIAERTSMSRLNGHENISISIQKQANANTIRVVDDIRKTLKFLNEDVKSRGMRYEIIYDHSIFIRQSLANLKDDALSGSFLVFMVLLIFLRAFGPAVIVVLSVPISVLGTFFMMSLLGITLNTMSIAGLVISLGIIVDASIVVLENIFRKRQMGANTEQAAIEGTEEVFWPVVTSNLTTIAVFFPVIAFVPGIAGQIFKDLSWTIIFTQIFSTAVPLTLVAMLSTYIKVKVTDYRPFPWTKFLEDRLNDQVPLEDRLKYARRMLLMIFGACFLGFTIFSFLDVEVLPKVDQGQFLLKIDMPLGTRLEVTDHISQQLEAALKEMKQVKNIAVTIGSEKSKKGEIKIETLRPSQAIILVTLDRKKTGRHSARVVREFFEKIKNFNLEGAKVDAVLQESEFAFAEGGEKPISILVKGYDYAEMRKITQQLKTNLMKLKGVFAVQDNMGESAAETKLQIDKRRAALYGISALDISLIAKAALDGVVATQYREAGREYDIRVRLSEEDRKNQQNLQDLLLYSQVLNELIPLKDVASIEKSESPSEIRRFDQERTITIQGDIAKRGVNSKKVLSQVQKMIRELKINPSSGIQVVLSGKAREVKENFTMVIFAFTLAILLVYMIMASQFESFAQPLIIMLTVPLALFGVAISLWITGHTLNVISMLGMVLLAGTAVNNGIVLIEFINQAREEGMSIENAAIEAAKVRTRPILMSAITTVMGLVPLALGLGEGAELRSPMAVAMIGGTISSTFLTLVVIPLFYIFITRTVERYYVEPDEVEEEINPKPEPPAADSGPSI